MKSKHDFFRKGSKNQPTADVSIEFSRISDDRIAKFSQKEKDELFKYLQFVTEKFNSFKRDMMQL